MNTRAKVATWLVLLALVAGGVWWVRRPAPVADGVLFVGDSVTFLTQGALTRDLSPKHPTYVTGIGFRSTDLLPAFAKEVANRRLTGQPLRQVALLVGYNDALRHDVETPSLNNMMALANQFDCAVWLTLPPFPQRAHDVDRWNTRAKAIAASYRHIHVVDTWRQAVMAALPRSILSKDGVHPNDAGRQRLAQIYENAIAGTC
ncbi:MAG: SGNH/GDSL hydrolase family protein [Acidimicrobiales bacterium]